MQKKRERPARGLRSLMLSFSWITIQITGNTISVAGCLLSALLWRWRQKARPGRRLPDQGDWDLRRSKHSEIAMTRQTTGHATGVGFEPHIGHAEILAATDDSSEFGLDEDLPPEYSGKTPSCERVIGVGRRY